MMDGGFVKRVTPVTILPDIGPMVDHYLALGSAGSSTRTIPVASACRPARPTSS